MATQQRYQGLDHLRGILALVVMVYHFSDFLNLNNHLPFLVQRPLNLLGLYAVSTFYGLSGVALFIVYRSRKVDRLFLSEFIIKRSFRICPLFWAATTASIAMAGFVALKSEPFQVLLSYTLFFSWVDPTAYFTTGAWSIGNEWAFYTLFPLFLIGWRRPWSRQLTIASCCLASCYYAFFLISPQISVADQWATYISPLNQVILFIGGMGVGSLIVNQTAPRASAPILWASGLLFLAISYVFDKQQCIHGYLRLVLVAVCLAWCYGVGLFRHQSGKIRHALDWLGALSYSVYLLHPIVFRLVDIFIQKILALTPDFIFKGELQKSLIFLIAFIMTMLASHLSYKILELPMMRAGRYLARKKTT